MAAPGRNRVSGLQPIFAGICASSSSDAKVFIERTNRDVTERQAHGSQLVRVQPEETPGSSVAALPASSEISASKRRKTVSERRRVTGRSAASREACSVVSKTLAGRGQEEAEPVDTRRRPWTALQTWSECPRILRRRERGTVRRVPWELEGASVAPGSASSATTCTLSVIQGWPTARQSDLATCLRYGLTWPGASALRLNWSYAAGRTPRGRPTPTRVSASPTMRWTTPDHR